MAGYYDLGIDEILYIDVVASYLAEIRSKKLFRRRKNIFIPLTVMVSELSMILIWP